MRNTSISKPSEGRAIFAGFLFVLIATYPASPVLYMLLSAGPQASFALFSLIAVITFSLIGVKRKRWNYGRWSLSFNIVVGLFVILLFSKLALHRTPIAARELLVLGSVFTLLGVGEHTITKVLSRGASALIVILTLSFFVVAISYYLGIIDFRDWYAPAVRGIHRENPILVRTDSDFYFPLFLGVIPYNISTANSEIAFGIVYQRQPLIFTEWTYTWYFVTPFLIIGMNKKLTAMSIFKNGVLALVLSLSISVWGVLAALATFGMTRMAKVLRSSWRALLLALIVVGLLYSILGLERILELIGGNKLSQLYYFAAEINFDAMNSALGDASRYEGGAGNLTWGALSAGTQYGWVGMTSRVAVSVMGIAASAVVLSEPILYRQKTRRIAVAVLFLCLMGLKVPYLVSFVEFLFIGLLCQMVDSDRSQLRRLTSLT